MKKVSVEYKAGQSRYEAGKAIDYMLAVVDGIELYAEMEPIDGDETATYDDLKAEIIQQAQEKGIDASLLVFHYDIVLYNANQLSKLLGITREAVRRRLMRGTLRGDYFTADGQPLFTYETAMRIKKSVERKEDKPKRTINPLGR